MNIKKTFIYALTTVFLFTAVGESFAKTLKERLFKRKFKKTTYNKCHQT